MRRISGRHQISEDGKHLIDGVAFGRPFLRKTARPAIKIPPRKRQRIAYEEDEGDAGVGQVDDRQIVVRAGFEDTDEFGSDEDDDDFEPGDEESLDEELKALHADSEDQQATHNVVEGYSGAHIRTRSYESPQGLGLLSLYDHDGHILSGPYSNPLLDEYSQDQPSHLISALKVRKRGQRTLKQNSNRGVSNVLKDPSMTSEHAERRDSTSSNKSVRFEDQEDATPATIRVSEGTDDEDDDDYEPGEVDESDKENAPPRSQGEEPLDKSDGATETSSSSFSEYAPFDSEETSSSGSSSSLSSDSEPEELLTKESLSNQESSDSTSTSTSSSTSSGDSDSDSEVENSPQKSDASANTSIDDIDTAQPKIQQPMNPPGTGKRRTRKRNKRRRQTNNLKKLIIKGDLPSDATYKDLHSFRESRNSNVGRSVSKQQDSQQTVQSGAADFEARRQALLESVASDGVEVSQSKPEARMTANQQEDISTTLAGDKATAAIEPESDSYAQSVESRKKQGPDSPIVQVPDSLEKPEAAESVTKENSKKATNYQENPDTQTFPDSKANVMKTLEFKKLSPKPASDTAGSQQRRSRLDLASSKRLLFGSLGLKTPKTKEDASNLQAKLAKDVRQAQQPKPGCLTDETANDTSNYDDESWRDKIELKAVECCWEGVEYSTPPFPFVQRWDPQQRLGTSRSRRKTKNKKRKRNDSSYYESQYDDSFNDYEQVKSPRRQDYKPASAEPNFQDAPFDGVRERQQNSEQNSHDLQDAQAASNQLMHKTVDSVQSAELAMEQEDLPMLPHELTACPALKLEDCKPGAVIAFKKFEMSVVDGWQPYISEHRTAMVDNFNNENGSVEMTWARRDQPLQQERYDTHTGERIYGKFEMREFEECKDDDISKVSVMFAELIDPILVRAADDNSKGIGSNLAVDIEQGNGDEMKEPDFKATFTKQSFPVEGQKSVEAHQKSSPRKASLSQTADIQDEPQGASPTQSDNNKVKNIKVSASVGIEEDPIDAPQANTQARQEISELIKDAGWRSSVGPEIKQNFGLQDGFPEDTDTLNYDETLPSDLPSPRFNGFSDPPVKSLGDHASPHSPAVKSSQPNIDKIGESLPPSPQKFSLPISPSKLDISVSYPSLPDLNADDESDTFPNERQHRSFSFSPSPSQEQSPSLISPPSLRRQRLAQHTPSPEPAYNSPVKEKISLYNSIDGAADDSSDEFPALFSQKFEARLSQDVESIRRDASQTSDLRFSNSPKTKKRQTKPSKTKPTTKAKTRTGINGGSRVSSHRTPKLQPQVKDEEDDILLPFSSQLPRATQSQASSIPAGSQIIDLTQMSSDPVEMPNDVEGDSSWKLSSISTSVSDEGSSLPRGAGWISKFKRRAKGR